jgi:hypothetical protein
LNELLATNAHYREAIYRKDVAQRVFGKSYYEWYPFIYERFPAFYFSLQQRQLQQFALKPSVFTTLGEVEEFSSIDTEGLFNHV